MSNISSNYRRKKLLRLLLSRLDYIHWMLKSQWKKRNIPVMQKDCTITEKIDS